MQAHCCGRWFYHSHLADSMAWCPACLAAPSQAMGGGAAEKQPANNPNEPPSEYPWRRKRAAGKAIAPPPKRATVPWRGVVEQCSPDGSCYLAGFPDLQEKVLIYQQDMMGVPAAGQSIEACIFCVNKVKYSLNRNPMHVKQNMP